MPNQVPWSDCVHCNNKMLAAHKHNASALFGYTQRYYGPRAKIQRQGVAVPNPLQLSHKPPDRGPQITGRAPRTSGAMVLGA